LVTLVGLEARALRQNRMACAVLVLAVIAAVSLRLGRDRLAELGRGTCYVVYWERDEWVRRLEAAAVRENQDRLPVRVVHASELTDAEGIIRYPLGAHSIQLRPTHVADRSAGDRGRTWHVSVDDSHGRPGASDVVAPETSDDGSQWTVWFWHSGSDPAALWPYSQWFWRVTAEHFGTPVRFDERVSSLEPQAEVASRMVTLTLAALAGPEWIEIGLVWMIVLFTACHLAGQRLAEDRTSRTIESVLVSPAGRQGAALAKRLFYGALAMTLGALVAAVLHPAALVTGAFWIGLTSAMLVALGVAWVAGAGCRSVAAVSAASVVYLAVAGALFAAVEQLSGGSCSGFMSAFSFERNLLNVWRTAWGAEAQAPDVAYAALAVWACGWQVSGAWLDRPRD
jgi:hypothetical protein